MQKHTRELSLCAVCCALAVVLLCLGSLLPFAAFAAPALSSAVLLAVRESCRPSLSWCCFAATAALALLLAPDKEAAMLYVFLGCYPLLQPWFNALRPMILRLCAKLLFCAAASGAMYALLIAVFQMEELAREFAESAPALLWGTAALGAAAFLMYDLMLTRMLPLIRRRASRRRGRADH